jgi:hypothetical protein
MKNPNSRTETTYLLENFDLLETSGHLKLIGSEMNVCSGIKVFHAGGHTRGIR